MTEYTNHAQIVPTTLFSEAEFQVLMQRLLALLAKQTEKYTMGESSSVTVDTAQDLMASLWYTLTLALDESHTPYDSLLTGDLSAILKQGQTILQGKLVQTKRLWEVVCRTAPGIPNAYYLDTLRGIGNYLKHYDFVFFAHQRPPCIDYPLLMPVSESLQGITYTKQYLKHLLTENLIFRTFDQKTVVTILQRVAPDYQEYYLNLCEQPLTNALGLSLLGEDGRILRFSSDQQMQLETKLRYVRTEKLQSLLEDAVLVLCKTLCVKDDWTKDYLHFFADILRPRLKAAADAENLTNVFIKIS